MTGIGPAQLLILALVLIVLFGAKRLPDAARALGRSLRIFRAEIKELDTQPQHPGSQQL